MRKLINGEGDYIRLPLFQRKCKRIAQLLCLCTNVSKENIFIPMNTKMVVLVEKKWCKYNSDDYMIKYID